MYDLIALVRQDRYGDIPERFAKLSVVHRHILGRLPSTHADDLSHGNDCAVGTDPDALGVRLCRCSSSSLGRLLRDRQATSP